MARSNEPLWWGPFSAGMMIDALCVPALVFITGFLWPIHRPGSATEVQGLLNAFLTRIFLVVVISLSFFHAAHRFRFFLVDVGVKGGRGLVATLAYGLAIAGSLAAIGIAVRLI
jgi:fumarate reductase subunit D